MPSRISFPGDRGFTSPEYVRPGHAAAFEIVGHRIQSMLIYCDDRDGHTQLGLIDVEVQPQGLQGTDIKSSVLSGVVVYLAELNEDDGERDPYDLGVPLEHSGVILLSHYRLRENH